MSKSHEEICNERQWQFDTNKSSIKKLHKKNCQYPDLKTQYIVKTRRTEQFKEMLKNINEFQQRSFLQYYENTFVVFCNIKRKCFLINSDRKNRYSFCI